MADPNAPSKPVLRLKSQQFREAREGDWRALNSALDRAERQKHMKALLDAKVAGDVAAQEAALAALAGDLAALSSQARGRMKAFKETVKAKVRNDNA